MTFILARRIADNSVRGLNAKSITSFPNHSYLLSHLANETGNCCGRPGRAALARRRRMTPDRSEFSTMRFIFFPNGLVSRRLGVILTERDHSERTCNSLKRIKTLVTNTWATRTQNNIEICKKKNSLKNIIPFFRKIGYFLKFYRHYLQERRLWMFVIYSQ